MVVLVAIETADLMFAVDSVPAVLAVSDKTFIIYSTNAFAILGLRALYFLLAGMLEKFHYLGKGLAFILAFIGVKMIISEWYHIPIGISLGVIAVALAASIVWSMLTPPGRGRRPAKAGGAHFPGRTGKDPRRAGRVPKGHRQRHLRRRSALPRKPAAPRPAVRRVPQIAPRPSSSACVAGAAFAWCSWGLVGGRGRSNGHPPSSHRQPDPGNAPIKFSNPPLGRWIVPASWWVQARQISLACTRR